jgi:hypothetical protein
LETDFNKFVINALRGDESVSKKNLVKRILRSFPDLTESAINWRLHSLKSSGSIHSPHYGAYSLKSKENYQPLVKPSLKRLFNKIRKEFGQVDLCVWDSHWFDSFLPIAPASGYIVAEVPKEYIESIFNSLTDLSKKVYLDPGPDIYKHYISNNTDSIVIKAIISESPIIEIDNTSIASLEKLLVDSLAEQQSFFFLDGCESESLFKKVAEKYNLSLTKMKRYSKRRSQHEQLNQILSKINKHTY